MKKTLSVILGCLFLAATAQSYAGGRGAANPYNGTMFERVYDSCYRVHISNDLGFDANKRAQQHKTASRVCECEVQAEITGVKSMKKLGISNDKDLERASKKDPSIQQKYFNIAMKVLDDKRACSK